MICSNGTESAKTPKVYFLHAGAGIRLAAFSFDCALASILAAIALAAALKLKTSWPLYLFSAWLFAYKPLSEALTGATLGKLLCDTHVVNDKGKKLTFAAAYKRFALFIPLIITCVITLSALYLQLLNNRAPAPDKLFSLWHLIAAFILTIDCSFVILTKDKLALHDTLSGSIYAFRPGKKLDVKKISQTWIAALTMLILTTLIIIFLAFDPVGKLTKAIASHKEAPPLKAPPRLQTAYEPVVYQGCVVTGIMSHETDPAIVIGKESYGIGDTVCGAEILDISQSKATIQIGSITTEVSVGGKIGKP